jgi:hypothetical protein
MLSLEKHIKCDRPCRSGSHVLTYFFLTTMIVLFLPSLFLDRGWTPDLKTPSDIKSPATHNEVDTILGVPHNTDA